MSSITGAEDQFFGDSAYSEDFAESTRRPSDLISSSEDTDGHIVVFIKRKIIKEHAILSKRQRIAEAAAKDDETGSEDDSDSFMQSIGLIRSSKKASKKPATKPSSKKKWQCHICQSSGPETRGKCDCCGKFVHKICRSYGLCVKK